MNFLCCRLCRPRNHSLSQFVSERKTSWKKLCRLPSLLSFNMNGNQRKDRKVERFKNMLVSKFICKSQCTYLKACCSALAHLNSSTKNPHKFVEDYIGITKQLSAFRMKNRMLLQITPCRVKRFTSKQQTPGGSQVWFQQLIQCLLLFYQHQGEILNVYTIW